MSDFSEYENDFIEELANTFTVAELEELLRRPGLQLDMDRDIVELHSNAPRRVIAGEVVKYMQRNRQYLQPFVEAAATAREGSPLFRKVRQLWHGEAAQQETKSKGLWAVGYKASALPEFGEGVERRVLANRKGELAEYSRYLEKNRLLVIAGVGGVGKTTVVRALLEQKPKNTPPPFWFDFSRNPETSIGDLLNSLASYLGPPVRQQLEAYRGPREFGPAHVDLITDFLNREPSVWLVFDNVETVLAQAKSTFVDEQVDAFFSGLRSNTHKAKVILTSRVIPRLRTGERLLEPLVAPPPPLTGLLEQDAVDLLRSFGLEERPYPELAKLAQMVEGHPFALLLLAGEVQEFGAEQALATAIEWRKGAAQRLKDYRSLFNRLSTTELRVLQRASILRREVTFAGLQAIAGASRTDVGRLRKESLLEVDHQSYYWLHPLVRDAAQPEEEELRIDTHGRAREYYRSRPLPADPKCKADLADVLEWRYHAIQSRDIDSAYAALFETYLHRYLISWGELRKVITFCEEILAIDDAARPVLDALHRCRVLSSLGYAQRLQGDLAASIEAYEQALASLPDGSESLLRADLLRGLADTQRMNNQLEIAQANCQRALTLLSDQPEGRSYARALHVLGVIKRYLGDMDGAAHLLAKAQDLYEQVGDQRLLSYATGELGTIYSDQFKLEEAIHLYLKLVRILEGLGDRHGIMVTVYNIGDAYVEQGEYERASEYLERAISEATKGHLTWMQLMAGLLLAEALLECGRATKASEQLTSLERLDMGAHDHCQRAHLLALQGRLLSELDQEVEAAEQFKEAMGALQMSNCPYELPKVCLWYGKYLKLIGQRDEAQAQLERAGRGYKAIGNPYGMQAVTAAVQVLGEA